MPRPWALKPPPISEDDVEAGCLTILKLHHYHVIRCHAGVYKTLDDRRHIQGVPKGHPDYACMHGTHRNFLLEVKRPGGKLNPNQEFQIQFLRDQYSLPVVVAEDPAEFARWLAIHERSP